MASSCLRKVLSRFGLCEEGIGGNRRAFAAIVDCGVERMGIYSTLGFCRTVKQYGASKGHTSVMRPS